MVQDSTELLNANLLSWRENSVRAVLAMKHASVCGVNGTVSWFVGGLCFLKDRRRYRFTDQASFHLSCKFL